MVPKIGIVLEGKGEFTVAKLRRRDDTMVEPLEQIPKRK